MSVVDALLGVWMLAALVATVGLLAGGLHEGIGARLTRGRADRCSCTRAGCRP
jgi:hypothetical protein